LTVYVCSLILSEPHSIPNDGGYHIVRFPYDVTGESYDAHGMHQQTQPDGYQVVNWQADDRSGLIWPAVSGWGVLTANIHWESGNYSELRDRFVRDPLGLSTGYDSTATDHRPPSPGMQCFTKQHQMFVHPGTPVSLLVAQNASTARKVKHAQFKLAIHPTQGGA
jgi:hypothetical protein